MKEKLNTERNCDRMKRTQFSVEGDGGWGLRYMTNGNKKKGKERK
jgi:glutamate synthase domain-containing protein 3